MLRDSKCFHYAARVSHSLVKQKLQREYWVQKWMFEKVQEAKEETTKLLKLHKFVQLRHIFGDSGFTLGGWLNC